jgi:hypothetical protein
VEGFTQRLERRRALWWARPRLSRGGRSVADAVHRLRERRAVRAQDDADDAWHCCPFWVRTLLDKRNSRAFAARHGLRLPELYWTGRRPSRAVVAALPDRFVLRPARGSARRGAIVVAGGRDLLDGGARFDRATLVRRHRVPVLLEEFVTSEDGDHRLPVEYKVHTFGDTVGGIVVITLDEDGAERLRFYRPDWTPFDAPMNTSLPEDAERPAPRCLPEILRGATTIGTALGTYARVDFFATARGAVFNEISSVPNLGRGFTPYCDELFGRLWAERLPPGAV